MVTTRTTFTIEEALIERARELGVNVSAAARAGVAAAIGDALSKQDRAAYEREPERFDDFWSTAEVWGED